MVQTHPNDLDLALNRHGLPAGNVGRLIQSAATILAAWERASSDEDWAAWSRSDGAEAMAELEAALETFAPEEGE